MKPARHVLFLHPELSLSGSSERLLRIALHLRSRNQRVTILSNAGSRNEEFRALDLHVEVAELPERPWLGVFQAGRTLRRVKELAPDLVYVTSERLAPLAALLRRDYVLELQTAPTARLPYHRTCLQAVVLPGRTQIEPAVNRAGLPRDRIRVVPHAPAECESAPLTGLEPGARIRIGTAGYLDESHGTETFVRAIADLKAAGSTPLAFILGEGPREQNLRRLSRELELGSELSITAPTGARGSRLLSMLDVFVSCRTAGEPGWLVHEALALGLPCILSTASGAFELVEDGESGVLVERADRPALVTALQAWIANPDSARRIGAQARRKFLSRRPAESFGQALDEILGLSLGV